MRKIIPVCLISFLLITLWAAACAVAGTVSYSYDSAGRLTEADYGDKEITYTYDSNGNLLEKKIAPATDDPVPDIKANGQEGPITVLSGTAVSITISLNPGGYAGQNADWWIPANTPFGWYSYVLPVGWTTGINLCVQTPLFNLSPAVELLNMALPAGGYTFYFGVDLNMNGSLDMDSIYYDSVGINVTGP